MNVATRSAPAGTTMRLSGRSQTFPALYSTSTVGQPDPRHVPRRYEETRAAFVQDFSHRRILSLGFDVHYRLRQQAEFERDVAVKNAEAKVRIEAEEEKNQALEELRKLLNVQTEHTIQRLKRQHLKALQEKVLEVETALRREMLEAVEKEKEEGRQRLVAAIEENDRKWEAIVIDEVRKARQEEVRKANEEKAEIRRQHEQAIKELTEKLRFEKEMALRNLERQKDSEREAAVEEARAEEVSLAKSRAAVVQEQHEIELQVLRLELQAEKKRGYDLEEVVAGLENEKQLLQDSLLNSRTRYVELVHRVFEEDVSQGLLDYMQAEDAVVTDILSERNVEPGILRGEAWRPHSPGASAGIGSVKLPSTTIPKISRIGDDFL